MIGLFIFLIGALAVVIGLLVYYFKRDRAYLKARTRDVLSDRVKKEIIIETHEAQIRQQRFKKALENAAKSAKSQDNSLTSNN